MFIFFSAIKLSADRRSPIFFVFSFRRVSAYNEFFTELRLFYAQGEHRKLIRCVRRVYRTVSVKVITSSVTINGEFIKFSFAEENNSFCFSWYKILCALRSQLNIVHELNCRFLNRIKNLYLGECLKKETLN